MRKFDLAAAKAGAPVCTRGGCAARIICFDLKSDHSVIARVPSAPDKEDIVEYWPDGRWYPACAESRLDLMMRDDDYAEKLARGEYGKHIDEATETDREYLRRELSEKIMVAMIRELAGKSPHSTSNNITVFEAMAADAVSYADALLEELEKTEKKL